jgi:hypothetical protein
MKGFKNIFALYPSKKRETATREINSAIKAKKWDNVRKLQRKYESIGAWDTASTDIMVEKYYRTHKRAPPGTIYFGKK